MQKKIVSNGENSIEQKETLLCIYVNFTRILIWSQKNSAKDKSRQNFHENYNHIYTNILELKPRQNLNLILKRYELVV